MINIGIIGAGSFAARHASTISKIEGLKLIAACRTNQEKLRLFCKEHNIKGYIDYTQLLKDQEINTILVSTPHHLHTKIAIDAIESGKHVLIEKPMAPSIEECDQIINAAKKFKVKLMVGQTLRFNPCSLYASSVLKSNQYGSIVLATANCVKLWNDKERKNWHLQKKSEGGILRTIGVHYIDYLNSLISSDVKSVFASNKTTFHSYETDDLTSLFLNYKNGSEAIIVCAGYQQGAPKMEIELYCENAIININYEKGVYIKREEKEQLNYHINIDKGMEEGLFNQWTEFKNAIQTNRRPTVSGEDGRQAIAVIEAAIKSSKLGRKIYLD